MRYNFTEDDVRSLVKPLLVRETIEVLKQLYDWSVVEPKSIDDEKYLLCKKLSEVTHPSCLGLQHANLIPATA